ncbi:hypothetical protein [Gemmata sp.]|uniref:hypothetical protein n=1 Tax=Gemmata sp. TaxID=1914242 RepID=UPI003F70BB85
MTKAPAPTLLDVIGMGSRPTALWYRPTGRGRWTRVGRAHDTAAALDLMETCGYRGGQWFIGEKRPAATPAR